MATSGLAASVSDPARSLGSGGCSGHSSSSPGARTASSAFPPDARAFDFSFAFNNPLYSDRLLLLRILDDDDDVATGVSKRTCSQRKSLCARGDNAALSPVRQTRSCSSMASKNPDEASAAHAASAPEPMQRSATFPQPPSRASSAPRNTEFESRAPQKVIKGGTKDPVSASDAEATGSFSEPSGGAATVRQVELHVISALLVSQSDFFRSLFSPEWSSQPPEEGSWKAPPVVISLSAEEEKTFLELVRFIYTGRLAVEEEPEEFLNLLLMANKYGVPSCVNMCAHHLREVPLSLDMCCVLLWVCSGVVLSESASFLVASSANFLVSRFGNLDTSWKSPEFLDLPLEALEAILGSDDLSVMSEETVLAATLHWVRHQCPDDMAQRKQLFARLAEKIRFPAMDVEALRNVALTAPEADVPSVQSLVMDALWFKCSSFERQQDMVLSSIRQHRRYVRRRQLSIHSEVLLQDCYMLQPGQAILLAGGAWVCGKLFSLKVMRVAAPVGGSNFGLFLQASQRCGAQDKVLDDSVSVEFSFKVKEWPAGVFVQQKQLASHTFKGLFRERGYGSLLNVWSEVMKDNNKYFRNGVMYLRADLRVIQPGESPTFYE